MAGLCMGVLSPSQSCQLGKFRDSRNWAVLWDIPRMTGSLDINAIRDLIRREMKAKGYSQRKLSSEADLSESAVRDVLGRVDNPGIGTLYKIAGALGVEPMALLDPQIAAPLGPRLYIKGEVAAGVWLDATELPPSEWQSFTGRAGVSASLEHRFGLRVVGDSMDQIYLPGTIVECISVFGHTEVTPGKRVIVIRKNHHGECEATIKELVQQDGAMWAVPRSNNPEHRPIKLDEPEEGIKETRIAAVVVGSYRAE